MDLFLTHIKPMFHLWKNQLVGFTSKICEKHLWKSNTLSKYGINGIWLKY